MRYKDIVNKINETPQEVGFNHDNIKTNYDDNFLKSFLSGDYETFIDNPNYSVLINKIGNKGNVILVTKINPHIEFIVAYDIIQISLDSSTKSDTIVQNNIWRDKSSKYTNGIAEKIFFDYFLKNYQIIMSSTKQTKEGNNFWIRMMKEATNKIK